MSEWPEFDWAHDPEHNPADTLEYTKIDKEIGSISYDLLDVLSRDVTVLQADADGWTELDVRSISLAGEVDWLSHIVVPPDNVSPESRADFIELMMSFRTALPFTEEERHWFLGSSDRANALPHHNYEGDELWQENTRLSVVDLMSAGVSRVIHGQDLMKRWWSWRREVDEYDEQGSLDQARDALRDIIALLAPELGVPESYEAL